MNADTYDRRRRDCIGIRPKSTLSRLEGVCSLVGGVDPSDKPEDPAVDGRPSSESFLTVDFFRVGADSGQVHCQACQRRILLNFVQEVVRLVDHVYTACSLALPRHTVRAF